MALALTLMASAAHAQSSSISVQVAPNVQLAAARVETQLRVELAGVHPAPSAVAIGLAGPDPAVLEAIVSFEDGRVSTTTVDLADVPIDERERVLALALAEAVLRAPDPVAATPRPPQPAAAPPAVATWRFGGSLALGVRGFTSGAVSPDPSLTGFVRHRVGARVDLGLRYLWTRATTTLGTTTMNAVLGSLRLSWDWPLGSRFGFRVGPRLDVGPAFGNGKPARATVTASSITTPFVMLLGEADVRWQAIAHLALVLGLDAGGVLHGLGLQADAESGADARGITLGAHLGIEVP